MMQARNWILLAAVLICLSFAATEAVAQDEGEQELGHVFTL